MRQSALAGCLAIAAIALGSCGESLEGVRTTADETATSEPDEDATASPTEDATPEPTPRDSKARIGDTIRLTGVFDEKIAVHVLRIVEAPQVGEYDEPSSSSSRFVAVEMTVTNEGTVDYEDAPGIVNKAILDNDEIAANGLVTEGPCAPFGQVFKISPGDRRRGCAVFEVPDGRFIRAFQFTTNLGNGETGEWIAPVGD